MDFRLLGPLEVGTQDGSLSLGGAKQRTVLVHLLLRANALVSAERLIDEVWGDMPPAAARNVLQTYVSRLRKALGAGRLERESGGYVLHAEPSEIDAHRFEALVRDARQNATSDPGAARACIGRPKRCGAGLRSTISPTSRRCGRRSATSRRFASRPPRSASPPSCRSAATPRWSLSWRR